MEFRFRHKLGDLLRSALDGTASELHLRELSRVFHVFALNLIRRKLASGKLNLVLIGLSAEDIAHDCLADIFRRNEKNQLVELCQYVESKKLCVEEFSEEKLTMQLRRFVFQKVNDSVFRLYNEIDPALGKILRNVKIAIDDTRRWTIVEMFGEQYIVPSTEDRLQCLPTIDIDALQDVVNGILLEVEEVPDILSLLFERMMEQKSYQRRIRLITLAFAIKQGHVMTGYVAEAESTDFDSMFEPTDVKDIIDEVCNEISCDMKHSYVDKQKVDEATFAEYVEAIRRILSDEYLEWGDGQLTYHEQLQRINPEISKDEYMSEHRVIFEYLAKLSKQRAKERLKRM